MKCLECDFENPPETSYCGRCGTRFPSAGDISFSATKTFEASGEESTLESLFSERYQIIEELGKGGMGKVYRALDKKLQEEVALKLIRPELALDRKTLERFSNELRLARKVVHKNVGRMYELLEVKGTHFITMEYVAGEDLKSFIKRSKRLSVETALNITKQVAEGLAEAHRLGIVHRDLKPSNIMIDKEGNARIMDFGIARSVRTKGMTGEGVIIGTPEYMSPEQVEGKEADQRSDIYSLGIILFEMLTGRVPFEGDTPLSVAVKHKTEKPLDPRKLSPHIPYELGQVILKCMEKEKDNRYQTAKELLTEIEKVESVLSIAEKGITTRRTGTWRVSSTNRRKYFVYSGAALLFVAVMVIILFLMNKTKPPSKAELSPEGHTLVHPEGISKLPEWENSIAVLPFENISPDTEQEYFCDGMTEQLISNLAHIKELKVIARTSVMVYKKKARDIRQIAKELNVSNVLEGSIQKSGSRIRITAQLVSAEDGRHLWSENFDRNLGDIFAIQDEVSQSIVSSLQLTLTPETASQIKTPAPGNIEAYEYYLKSRHVIDTQFVTSHKEEDFQRSLEFAQKAIAIDPQYALAYHAMAYAYELHYWSGKRDPRDMEIQRVYIQKAYELNPNLAEINAAMGSRLMREGDFDKAFIYFKRAFQLNPNNWDVCHIFAVFYYMLGLHHQAIDLYTRAIALEPLNYLSFTNRSGCYERVGELEKAQKDAQRSLEIQPNYPPTLDLFASILILLKDFYEADQILTRLEKRHPDYPFIPFSRAFYYAAQGQKEKALALSKTARVYASLGMKDEALFLIPKEIEEMTFSHDYLFLKTAFIYDKLRDEPRFKDVVERQKEKYEEDLRKYRLF